MIRLCWDCIESARKLGLVDQIVKLCKARCWICPEGKRECGAVDGKTQAELRGEVLQKAILELVAEQMAERRPEKMN